MGGTMQPVGHANRRRPTTQQEGSTPMNETVALPAPATRKVGDKVSISHSSGKYPGVWIIKSIARVNATVEPVNGGRSLRCPMYMLTDPTEDAVAVAPTTYFTIGELVRVTAGKFAGLYVVIADKGGDRVNIALLGGDGDRYVRAARRGLVKVDVAEVLK